MILSSLGQNEDHHGRGKYKSKRSTHGNAMVALPRNIPKCGYSVDAVGATVTVLFISISGGNFERPTSAIHSFAVHLYPGL